jgi:hypothetical protein
MSIVQCSIQPNPDEIRKALDDPLVGENQTKNYKPRTKRRKEECWAAAIIAYYFVLEEKMSGQPRVI